jgi:predicted ABC-type ATPase
VIHFVNADLIAGGLSPLRPELAALAAGRLFLTELDRLAKARLNFAFESTLSGLVYLNRLKRWRSAGYRIEIVYLRLSSAQLALHRIAARVKQGGHNVPRTDVLRRFNRSWNNFQNAYSLLADEWTVYDNLGTKPRVLEQGAVKQKSNNKEPSRLTLAVGWALRRAGQNRPEDRPRPRHSYICLERR